MGVVGAFAQVNDRVGQGTAGTVEGESGEAGLGGGVDDGGRLDGLASSGEVLQKPAGAETCLGGWGSIGQGLTVTQGRDRQVDVLEDQAEGKRQAAEIGLDDLEAARAV